MAKNKKLRKLGDIMLDIEPYLEELVDTQDLQKGDILALVDYWVNIHRPGAIEQYMDGSNPIFYADKEVIVTLNKKKAK